MATYRYAAAAPHSIHRETKNMLTFIRQSANKTLPGFEYFHHFGTGYQGLIFTSHEAARKFSLREGCGYSGPLLNKS